jgi:hypothetical protein
MTIRWRNIVIAMLAVIATVVFFRNRDQVGQFLGMVRALGPGPFTTDERMTGLVALLCIVLLLAVILRILIAGERKS